MKPLLFLIASLLISLAICCAGSLLLMCGGAFVYWDLSIITFSPANWGEYPRLLFLVIWFCLWLIFTGLFFKVKVECA